MTRGQGRAPLTALQRKVLLALASAVGMRMLGLFLVLPVFTLYGLQFTDSRFLAGIAFGAYGLMMAVLQLPLGRLSDHIGRRRVLVLGMLVFSVGSILCAVPHWFPPGARIGALIVGRLVQGGGAITSVAFAAVADHIPPERRSTAMAVLGVPIGAAFAIGVIVGPVLAGHFGTALLFWLSGVLGLGTVGLLVRYLPDLPVAATAAPPAPLAAVLRRRALLPLDAGGFLMNFFMAAFFFYFPLIVTRQHHLAMSRYYVLLLPMAAVSGVTMFGFSRGADRGWARPLAVLAFLVFLPSTLLLFRPEALGVDPAGLAGVFVAGTLFYVGFTGLEPIMPSLVTRAAPAGSYGTALGVYNSLQFFGSFAGGAVAGGLAQAAPGHALTALVAASLLGAALMLMAR